MKILLTAINAKYIHSNLAIYSLKASAGEYGGEIELAEYTINNLKDYILEDIYKRGADVVCFSCYIWNLTYVEEIAREYHKLFPETPIWVGGPEVSYNVEDFLAKHLYITGVMIGEGEATFRELCGHYSECKDSENLTDIDGLAYRAESGAIVITKNREPIDMSSIPFCYDAMADFSNRIVYYESSRGCPFSCSYCLSSVDKSLRFRNLDFVKRELLFFIEHKVPQVKFVDRTFNCNHQHAMEIWRFIKEKDQGITNFHFEISADLMNQEELELISDMRPGLIQLEIGVQTTNEVTIREIHRSMKLDRIKEVVTAIKRSGNIHQHLDLIAGLPFEGYESFRNSFDEIFALWANQLQLGFLKVLKGSYLYDHAKEYGIVYHTNPPYEVMSTNWLTYEELLLIKRVEEMVEVYYNSGQFEVTMKLIDAMAASAFDFFRQLGLYYEKKGYLAMNHSRIRRCEILLAFLEEGERSWLKDGREKPEPEMLQEALTFDLYYRENCTTRPSWAADMNTFKDVTRKYCRNGKTSHIEPFHYLFPGKDQWGIRSVPRRMEKPVWVLFHYDERDPLDHQARTEYITV